MARSILIDTDPGQDDAVALLLAFASSPALNLRAVTTVGGNVALEKTTRNALRVRDLAQRTGVPVYAGAPGPIFFPLETAEFVCGPDGLAGADLPPASAAAEAAEGHGVDALIRIVREEPPGSVTLCALGPLTNVALALRLAPDIATRLDAIVIMGGAMALGNMTPAAEYNFFVDPHAAAITMMAGARITLFGLHATHQAIASPAHMERLAGLGTGCGRAVHGMLTRPRPGGLATAAHPMHDPCVIGWLLWPELFNGRHCYVEVATEAGPLRGRSTIDWNNRLQRTPNAFVVNEIDAIAFFDRLIAALAQLP